MAMHALNPRCFGCAVCVIALLSAAVVRAERSRFSMTHSRSQYVHWVTLYDADEKTIDPTDPNAKPYSPVHTCGRCHDYEAIGRGHHFNAIHGQASAGRPGEPWIWTDTRTGTQIPLSYRDWSGTYRPEELGITAWDFVLQFGRHLPGGGPGEPRAAEGGDAGESKQEAVGDEDAANGEAGDKVAEEDRATGRWNLSGHLAVDCMICHTNHPTFSQEAWWEQIQKENFGWASTAALGLANIDGSVSELPDDFDPATVEEDSRDQLPKTRYAPLRINAQKKVFFDIVRKPHDDACYYCHSNRFVGENTGEEWTYDEDVHLRAGISCTDCHRNGLEHHTVRGYEGELHPSGESVATLSCRGCHMDGEKAGGRMGAPKPLHKGLPPIHFEKLSCTACHSGPRPGEEALPLQTALAHGLGLPSHHYGPEIPPGVVAPVFTRDDRHVLYPHRMVWPAFWGSMKGDAITPLNPETAYGALRRTFRVRRGSTFTETLKDVRLSSEDKKSILGEKRAKVSGSELTEEEKAKLTVLEETRALEAFQKKLVEALGQLKEVIEDEGAEPVYVAGGKAYRLNSDGAAETFENPAAAPYAWKLGHDVRPARWSIGVKGCYECHAVGTPLFEGKVTALGPALDREPVTYAMYELAGFNKTKVDAWNQSFQRRTAFKWMGFMSMGIVGLILFSYLLLGVSGLFGAFRRR
ncbi:MAG: hypothetical protein ACC628_02740 [Pirellulaceae bacterium]